ncbi:MAG: hypothetical protein ACI845_000661 [Gammaproteobacteria bacterium]|jgi:hypothetical protein
MILCIEENNKLTLKDHLDFKHFSIADPYDQVENSLSFKELSESCGDDHYWLNAELIIGLSDGRDDSKWLTNFWDMLRAVEAYGYSDIENKKIKAHLVTDKK